MEVFARGNDASGKQEYRGIVVRVHANGKADVQFDDGDLLETTGGCKDLQSCMHQSTTIPELLQLPCPLQNTPVVVYGIRTAIVGMAKGYPH